MRAVSFGLMADLEIAKATKNTRLLHVLAQSMMITSQILQFHVHTKTKQMYFLVIAKAPHTVFLFIIFITTHESVLY